MNITLQTNLTNIDKYVQFIQNTYDINIEQATSISIPLINADELNAIKWNIGLICGGSGTGKSTILKNQFNKPLVPKYDMTKPVISQFDKLEPEEVCNILESVGMSSVPVWLRKPQELSVGEKARLDLCWSLTNTPKDNIIVIDEFTSTINREVAKSLSFALQRYIRNENLKIVISSCHFDIIEFLQPDWIFNLNKRSNDDVELEYIKYSDTSYTDYHNVNPKSILTSTYNI